MTKILIIDIETSPNIAYVWGAWRQNVSAKQWVENFHIMSVAWKWLDEEVIYYEENRSQDDSSIVKLMYSLLDEADVVVAHNGKRFDFPTIIGRGVVHHLTPPSPYHIVDTFLVAKNEMRLVQNSLEHLCNELDLPRKDGHKKYPGFELWIGCLRGEEEAWDEMREYNIQDVISLEALYLRLRPYMKYHPNVARATVDGEVLCPKCASSNIEYRGYYYTKAGLCYRRFRCKDCGGWGRVRYSEKDIPTSAGRNAT